MTSVRRLLIVSTHPAQTHVDLYRRLQLCDSLEVKVLFLRDTTSGFHDREFGRIVQWDVDLRSGYSHEFLKATGRRTIRIGGVKDSRLELPSPRVLIRTLQELVRMRPDVVMIPGHGDLWYLFVWLVCRVFRVAYILRGEGVLKSPPKGLRERIARRIARCQVRASAAFCYIGIANYFFGLENGAKAFFFSPYAIDTERFSQSILDPQARAIRRTAVGLDSAVPVVVFSAKLQPWKRPQDVIRAVAQSKVPLQALILGDGPLLEGLQRLAHELRADVTFAGFVNQADIPDWYALGDVFVLPSGPGGDTWGLSLNEALALGLTPVVSDAVPSWPDLAWSEGGVFPVGDTERLTDCILAALERRNDPAHSRALGAIRSRYSLEAAAHGIEAAVAQVMSAETSR